MIVPFYVFYFNLKQFEVFCVQNLSILCSLNIAYVCTVFIL